MTNQLIDYIRSQDAKFIFLALMLAVLPSLEVPKNLFALLFVLSWLVVSRQSKNRGGKWRMIDTIFLLWILVDVIIGINAVVVHDQPANGSKDIIKFVLVGWAISRSGFTSQQIIKLCIVATIFTVLPLGHAYINCSGGECISLNSVGHVNHTAIYLLIVYTLSLSLLSLNFHNLTMWEKVVLLLSACILGYVIVDTNSRAATGVMLIITCLCLGYLVFIYRTAKIWLIATLIAFSVLAIFKYNPPSVLGKFQTGSSLLGESPRQKIRNFSYYVFKKNPILGIGFGNFANLNHEHIKQQVLQERGVYNKNDFMPYAHPHNVYYTYLVGGGLVMFSIFAWFWLYMLFMIRRSHVSHRDRWLTFAGIGVTIANLGIGFVNTTLAHEHALITMFVLGLIIARDRSVREIYG